MKTNKEQENWMVGFRRKLFSAGNKSWAEIVGNEPFNSEVRSEADNVRGSSDVFL